MQKKGASAQSPFQEPNFGASGQKLRQIRYQSFLVMLKFFYNVLNIFFTIVGMQAREMGRKPGYMKL